MILVRIKYINKLVRGERGRGARLVFVQQVHARVGARARVRALTRTTRRCSLAHLRRPDKNTLFIPTRYKT